MLRITPSESTLQLLQGQRHQRLRAHPDGESAEETHLFWNLGRPLEEGRLRGPGHGHRAAVGRHQGAGDQRDGHAQQWRLPREGQRHAAPENPGQQQVILQPEKRSGQRDRPHSHGVPRRRAGCWFWH